jgi:hypothetical protein
MKRYLKIAINFLASLFVVASGTMQAARADEMWLDFSVPQADVELASPPLQNTPETAPEALTSQPSTLGREPPIVAQGRPSTPFQRIVPNTIEAVKPSVRASENTAKPVALDFGVPKADDSAFAKDAGSAIAPIATETPAQTPPPAKAKLPPAKKPSLGSAKAAIKTPTSKLSKVSTRKQQVTALRRAIIGQESAGKFWLVNPDSGALGYGQLLRENVAPWTKAALGRTLTPEEFLANPKLQIKTIDHKLNQYLKRELAYTGGKNEELAIRRVASAWYSGNPKLWNNTRPQYSNGRRYPSIASYTRSVWKRYLREIG